MEEGPARFEQQSILDPRHASIKGSIGCPVTVAPGAAKMKFNRPPNFIKASGLFFFVLSTYRGARTWPRAEDFRFLPILLSIIHRNGEAWVWIGVGFQLVTNDGQNETEELAIVRLPSRVGGTWESLVDQRRKMKRFGGGRACPGQVKDRDWCRGVTCVLTQGTACVPSLGREWRGGSDPSKVVEPPLEPSRILSFPAGLTVSCSTTWKPDSLFRRSHGSRRT